MRRDEWWLIVIAIAAVAMSIALVLSDWAKP